MGDAVGYQTGDLLGEATREPMRDRMGASLWGIELHFGDGTGYLPPKRQALTPMAIYDASYVGP